MLLKGANPEVRVAGVGVIKTLDWKAQTGVVCLFKAAKTQENRTTAPPPPRKCKNSSRTPALDRDIKLCMYTISNSTYF